MKTLGLLLVSLLVLLAGCSPSGLAPKKESAVTAGEVPAADFNIPDMANPSQQLSLASYKGQVVLLDFWATWCPPCRSELPSLNRLYSDLKQKGFVIVGMTVDQGCRTRSGWPDGLSKRLMAAFARCRRSSCWIRRAPWPSNTWASYPKSNCGQMLKHCWLSRNHSCEYPGS